MTFDIKTNILISFYQIKEKYKQEKKVRKSQLFEYKKNKLEKQ